MNLSTLLLFLIAVVGARLAWRRGARTLAAGAAAAAVLFGASLWQSTHPVVLTLLLALAGGVVVASVRVDGGGGDPLGVGGAPQVRRRLHASISHVMSGRWRCAAAARPCAPPCAGPAGWIGGGSW